MISDMLFDNIIHGLNKSLSFRVEKQNVISGNIANQNTPHYKAKNVEFESALKEAMEGESLISRKSSAVSRQAEFDSLEPSLFEESDVRTANDLNTVNLESEIAKMVENQVLYRGSHEMLNRKLSLLKYAVAEGGR